MNRLEAFRSLLWPAGIVLSAALAGLALALPQDSPLRVVFAFWFLLVCPGMAFIRLLRLHDVLVEASLAIALSIAIDTIIAEILVLTATWSPGRALAIIALISLLGAGLQLYRAVLPTPGVQR